MKSIRTLLFTSLAIFLSQSLAEAFTLTAVANTYNANTPYVSGSTVMTVRDNQGNAVHATGVSGPLVTASASNYSSSYGAQGTIYIYTYNFTVPDTYLGKALSIGCSVMTGYNSSNSTSIYTNYYTELFTAQNSVNIPLESFTRRGPSASVNPPTGPDVLPTGDLTIKNPATEPDIDFFMLFDAGNHVDTHATILSETGTLFLPTLSQRFAGQRGEWRWSLQTAATPPQEVKVMTLGATLSASPSNILSLYSAVIPPATPSPTIKLDPGTGAAGTAKITIDGIKVATVDQVVPLGSGGISILAGKFGIGTAIPGEQLSITGNFRLPVSSVTTGLPVGIIYSGSNPLIHDFGTDSFFAGVGAGNLAFDTASAVSNTAVGCLALNSLTIGDNNSAFGAYSLQHATTGRFNMAFGYQSLCLLTTGSWNVAMGPNTGLGVVGSIFNTYVGHSAGGHGNGSENTIVGAAAALEATGGSQNTSLGAHTLRGDFSGDRNTAIGYNAMDGITSGSENLALGTGAGSGYTGVPVTTGIRNILIGTHSGVSLGTLHNAIAIGYNAVVGASDSLVLGGADQDAVNVGIGTATPAARLHVVGDTLITGNLTTQGSAHVVGTATFDGPVRIAPQGDLSMGDFIQVAPATP